MIIAQIICEFIFTTFHKHRKAYVQTKTKVFELRQNSRRNGVKFFSIAKLILTLIRSYL